MMSSKKNEDSMRLEIDPEILPEVGLAADKRSFPYRYCILIMMFIGTFVAYVLRVNMNIAIVTMTDIPKEICSNTTAEKLIYNGKTRFCWSSNQQALVLGSFFYGYIVLQIPAGALTEKFGSKWLLTVMLGITSVLGFLTPWAANQGATFLVSLRVIQGLCEGVTYPSLPPLIKRSVVKGAFSSNFSTTLRTL